MKEWKAIPVQGCNRS